MFIPSSLKWTRRLTFEVTSNRSRDCQHLLKRLSLSNVFFLRQLILILLKIAGCARNQRTVCNFKIPTPTYILKKQKTLNVGGMCKSVGLLPKIIFYNLEGWCHMSILCYEGITYVYHLSHNEQLQTYQRQITLRIVGYHFSS